jgi:hypothetical protein
MTDSTRRYPRRILRGPQQVWFSRYAPHRKLHITADCEGLARTPADNVDTARINLTELANPDQGRPCRMCSLESVLYTVCPVGTGGEGVFVTFTSQATPNDEGTRLSSYQWSASTPSGRDRLVRVAKRFGFPLGQASCGPVTCGFVHQDAVTVLERNLRTAAVSDIETLPTLAQIEMFWTLADTDPVELNPDALDPWEMAALLAS